MTDVFKYGQQDLIYQLNQLAKAKDIVDIPQNSAAAAASAAASAAAAAAAAESDGTAATAASKAVAAFKSLDARYLGAKALPPTSDNAGGALLAGTTYWDTVLNGGCLRVFQAGAWVTIPANVASQISSTPVGGIVATNVQAALAELDAKKAARATTLAGYGITDALPSTYNPAWLNISGKPAFAQVATSGSKNDVGLGSVDNTSDANKPVSTTQQMALNLKAPINNPTFTGLLRAPVGGVVMGNDGTGIYSPINSTFRIITAGVDRLVFDAVGGTTFTGTVAGITKGMVGLSSVDNTSDANKPVSTAQLAALDLKAPINNPTLTSTALTATVHPGGLTVLSTANPVSLAAKSSTGYAAVELLAGDSQPSYLFSYTGATVQGRLRFDNGVTAGAFFIDVKRAGTLQTAVIVQGDYLYPNDDNMIGLGSFNRRWTTIYANSGAISTSDATHKTHPESLDHAELAAAVQLAGEIGKYKFLSAVEEKGFESARYHIGMTVQRVIEVMTSHGLDPFTYSFICYDEWPETSIEHPEIRDADTVDDVGIVIPGLLRRAAHVELRPAGSIYSFRPDGLSLFIARGQAARLDALETRLAAIEPGP